MALATGHPPTEVERWPVAAIEALEVLLVDRADHARIEQMKRSTP